MSPTLDSSIATGQVSRTMPRGSACVMAMASSAASASTSIALFSLVSGFMFHGSPEDQIHLMNNIAIAGGFLVLAVQGAGGLSLDAVLARRREESGS